MSMMHLPSPKSRSPQPEQLWRVRLSSWRFWPVQGSWTPAGRHSSSSSTSSSRCWADREPSRWHCPPTGRYPPLPLGGRASAEYEVLYALTGATAPGLDDLRRSLSDLGNSVVIVGDRTVAQVHVHAADAGPTIEAALDLGTLNRIRVTALDSP